MTFAFHMQIRGVTLRPRNSTKGIQQRADERTHAHGGKYKYGGRWHACAAGRNTASAMKEMGRNVAIIINIFLYEI